MPPKNQRGEKRSKFNEDPLHGSSSLSQRFVSQKAKEMFDFIKTSRKPISERGFDFVREECEEVFDLIGIRGWQKFCEQPKTANISLVREFYANAVERKDYQVIVRGKIVSFHPNAINNYYKFVADKLNSEFKILERRHDLDEIKNALCDTEVYWKETRGVKKYFLSNCLSLPMAIWYLFITTRLMPVTHISDVTRERAILLYAIKKGIYLDIGKLISTAILGNITSSKIGLYFPSLISDLCIKASVDLMSDDEWKQPMNPINETAINRLYNNKFNRGKAANSSAREQLTERPKSSKTLSLNARMCKIETAQEELKELKDWAKYQTTYNQCQSENMNSMDSLLRGIASHLNLDMTQYPSASAYPSQFKFKGQDRDEEEDEGEDEYDEDDEEGDEEEEDEGEEEDD